MRRSNDNVARGYYGGVQIKKSYFRNEKKLYKSIF